MVHKTTGGRKGNTFLNPLTVLIETFKKQFFPIILLIRSVANGFLYIISPNFQDVLVMQYD